LRTRAEPSQARQARRCRAQELHTDRTGVLRPGGTTRGVPDSSKASGLELSSRAVSIDGLTSGRRKNEYQRISSDRKTRPRSPRSWGGTPKLKNSKRRQADEPYSGISELKIPGGSFGNWPEGRGKEQRLGSHRGDDDAPSADFASARGCCGSLSGSLQVLLLWLEPTGPPDHAGGESTA